VGTTSQGSGHNHHHHRHPKHHDQFRPTRHKNDAAADFIDLTSGTSAHGNTNENNIELYEKSNLQISISPDEFCRNIDTIMDEQLSFTFSKMYGSRYHVAPPQLTSKHENKNKREDELLLKNKTRPSAAAAALPGNYESLNKNYIVTQASCKFPKWLNRKWFNFKQTKSFTLDYRLDSLFVYDEKNSIIINKYTCSQMKSKKANHIQAVVKSLNGW
jgi:hypothetical protein